MSEGYDVIIVGSGLVGSAYARILAERAPQLRMLIARSGPG
jgi:L-2-hydroxyglutarate oxidase LhgO